MVSIYTVSNAIIERTSEILESKNEEREYLFPLDLPKLQRLCYLTQGWHSVWIGERLIDEDFEAWRTGAVCRELHVARRGFSPLVPLPIRDEDLTKETLIIIDTLVKAYLRSDYTDPSEDTRKYLDWEEMIRDGKSPVIPFEEIVEQFKKMHQDLTNTNTMKSTENTYV